jgi:mannose-6-phosphate isomerase
VKAIQPIVVQKPWGREIWVAVEDEYVGKILEIKKGTRTSLQYHEKKKETIYVLSGVLKVETKTEELILDKGDALTLYPGDVHRLIAVEDLRLIETSTPELKDVVRVDDDYGRHEEN